MSRSGAFDRAAVNASSALVKNLAENPFIRNIAARVDAMTGSSSTTKIRVAGRGDT
jgi:allophanate hydrolase subunit 2